MTDFEHELEHRLRRRQVLWGVGRSAIATFGLIACSDVVQSAPVTDGDDDAFLERLMREARPRLPYRQEPYRLTRTVTIPAGVTLTIDPNTRIIWDGPVGSGTSLVSVFKAAGDNTGVVVSAGEAFIECRVPSPFVYAVEMRGFSGFTVTGIHSRECQQALIASTSDAYAEVKLEGPNANAARNFSVIGGGASYAKLQPFGHGACFLHFAADGQVRGARYRNVPNGVQWWGGNADPVRPPAEGGAANERKCRKLLVVDVTVEHVAGAGIWGALGQDIVVRQCTVNDAGDVAFDAEGCNQVTFDRCTASNGRNGCFTTFFLCNGVKFVNCTGVVDNKAFPLLRVYNESQTNWDNKGLEIIGGFFECRDQTGPATIDTAFGPVGTLSIIGAKLKNVRIDVAHSNMHKTVISGNTLDLPFPLRGKAAITAGASKSLQKAPTVIPGGVIVENNIIRYTAQPAGSDGDAAILLREDDFNSSAVDRLRGNRVSGHFATGVALISASPNAGVVPSFTITGNRFSGLAPTARLLSIEREAPTSQQPTIRWDDTQTRDGAAVPLARALR